MNKQERLNDVANNEGRGADYTHHSSNIDRNTEEEGGKLRAWQSDQTDFVITGNLQSNSKSGTLI